MNRAEYTRALRFHAEKLHEDLVQGFNCMLKCTKPAVQAARSALKASSSVRWRARKGSMRPSAATKQAGAMFLRTKSVRQLLFMLFLDLFEWSLSP